jgi:hypothetical protein
MAAAFATRAETDPDRHVHGVATGLRYAVEALDSPAPASSPAAWDIVTLDEVYRRAGRIVPDACCDRGGQHYGIASVREIVTNMMRDVLPPAPADGEEREP